jgi:hypothetical protein
MTRIIWDMIKQKVCLVHHLLQLAQLQLAAYFNVPSSTPSACECKDKQKD